MNQVTEALAEAELLDEEGHPHRMRELWAERPALILFVRHFG